MARSKAALILRIRENATVEKAYKKVMIANHPDSGSDRYLTSKINEAEDAMLGKRRDGGSAF